MHVVVAQFWQWQDNYDLRNDGRATAFEVGVPSLLKQAFAGGGTVYIDHDDVYAQTHALWYAVTHGLSAKEVSIPPRLTPIGRAKLGS